jgi:anti-sigma B factor antagonist
MKMEVLERGETNVWIHLDGRLDLKGVEEIQLGFTVKASRSDKPVVVDFSGVTFVGSLGIGMLFAAARGIRLRGSRMILFGTVPHVEEVLRNASLDQVAELVATEDEARVAVAAW